MKMVPMTVCLLMDGLVHTETNNAVFVHHLIHLTNGIHESESDKPLIVIFFTDDDYPSCFTLGCEHQIIPLTRFPYKQKAMEQSPPTSTEKKAPEHLQKLLHTPEAPTPALVISLKYAHIDCCYKASDHLNFWRHMFDHFYIEGYCHKKESFPYFSAMIRCGLVTSGK